MSSNMSFIPSTPPDIDVHLIRQERVMLDVPTDHLLADREMIGMGELCDQEFTSHPASQGPRVRESMMPLSDETGFLPHVTKNVPDPYRLLYLVGCGVWGSPSSSSLRCTSASTG